MLKRSTPFYPTPLPGRIPGYRRERLRPKLLAEAKLFARARPEQVTRQTKNDLAVLLTLNHACPGDAFHNASPGALFTSGLSGKGRFRSDIRSRPAEAVKARWAAVPVRLLRRAIQHLQSMRRIPCSPEVHWSTRICPTATFR